LNYGPSAKDSQLTAAMFYKDTAGTMDIANPTTAGDAGNAGLRARQVELLKWLDPYLAMYL
jgi:hypothetical protein